MTEIEVHTEVDGKMHATKVSAQTFQTLRFWETQNRRSVQSILYKVVKDYGEFNEENIIKLLERLKKYE